MECEPTGAQSARQGGFFAPLRHHASRAAVAAGNYGRRCSDCVTLHPYEGNFDTQCCESSGAVDIPARSCSFLREITSSWIFMSLIGALAIHDDGPREAETGNACTRTGPCGLFPAGPYFELNTGRGAGTPSRSLGLLRSRDVLVTADPSPSSAPARSIRRGCPSHAGATSSTAGPLR